MARHAGSEGMSAALVGGGMRGTCALYVQTATGREFSVAICLQEQDVRFIIGRMYLSRLITRSQCNL